MAFSYRCARCGRHQSRSDILQDPRDGRIYCRNCARDALKGPASRATRPEVAPRSLVVNREAVARDAVKGPAARAATGEVGLQPVAVHLEADDVAVLRVLAEPGESMTDTLRRVLKSIGRDYVAHLAPRQFERLVGQAFEKQGYRVTVSGGPGDQGIDVLATKEARTIVVQCKRYDAAEVIAPRQIRELLGAATAVKASEAIFVTTSTFTAASREFASSQSIRLIDIEALPKWLENPDAPRTDRGDA